MRQRLLLTIAPRPDASDFVWIIRAVTDAYPGLMMDCVRQTDDGFEVWVPADARPFYATEDET